MSRTGSSTTAPSGSSASVGSTNTCASCRWKINGPESKKFTYRRRSMVTKNSSTLTVTLPSEREITLTREFDAPRELLFEAFCKPEHMAQWWGQKGSTLAVCDMDFRP